MKQKSKLHLIDSDEPLSEYGDLKAICGEEVKRAVFELKFTEDTFRDLEDMLDGVRGLCRDCRQLVLEGRYVYGIRPGEEKKQELDEQDRKLSA